MGIEVETFDVTARPHPACSNDNLQWNVFIRIKFRSEDPSNWGELRAYGGSWIRTLNRTTVKTGVRKETNTQVMAPIDIDIEDLDVAVNAVKNLPVWPGYRPTFAGNPMEKDLRLGNDQHIEIFYAKQVPNLPRSCPTTKDSQDPRYVEYDPMIDTMSYDNPRKTDRRYEIDLKNWHIFGRDEPQRANYAKVGDYVEYYHAGEFHIRPPGRANVIAKRKLLLVITGKYGEFQYRPPVVE